MSVLVISKNFLNTEMVLMEQETPFRIMRYEDTIIDVDGTEYILEGGIAPLTRNSEGNVWVKYKDSPLDTREFYPSVFDLKWVDRESLVVGKGPRRRA